MICPTGRAKYFCARDWTVDSALMGLEKFDFGRNEDLLTGSVEKIRSLPRSEAWKLLGCLNLMLAARV